MELTTHDLDTILEALEAWGHSDRAGEMMLDILVDAVKDKNGPPPPDVAAELAKRKTDREAVRAMRKEKSILLRAKIISAKQELANARAAA